MSAAGTGGVVVACVTMTATELVVACGAVIVDVVVAGTGGGTTTGATHVGFEIGFVSSVTAPVRAKTLPEIDVPVFTVIDDNAMIVPTKFECVPRVADEPICQKTLQACAPPTRFTLLADAVVRADPTWKTNTAFGFPCASSVTVPVRPSDEADL